MYFFVLFRYNTEAVNYTNREKINIIPYLDS